jgi:two-component system cell cycle sensor histidine kinase PleC
LIDDLLDLSRAEAGAPLLEIEAFDLGEVLSECIAAVAAQSYAEDLQFDHQVDTAEVEIVADRRAVRQIAANLLSNAAKFSPKSGTVVSQITANSAGIAITISDDGPGLTDAEITRALEPFGQVANQTLSRAPRGAGVGLPLVKALTEAHGGTLLLKNSEDRGLTAVVWLPTQ